MTTGMTRGLSHSLSPSHALSLSPDGEAGQSGHGHGQQVEIVKNHLPIKFTEHIDDSADLENF